MPRQPDPELEDRILNAAHALWKRGGEQALTMRAVARAARTNTPAVYRRFKDREDVIRALVRRTVAELRERFEAESTVEGVAEAYMDYALQMPHDYELFYTHVSALTLPKVSGRPRPIRESRPNFGLAENLLARRLGGMPEDHTQLALALWGLVHGTCSLILSKAIPDGHETELRRACRAAIKALLDQAKVESEDKLRARKS